MITPSEQEQRSAKTERIHDLLDQAEKLHTDIRAEFGNGTPTIKVVDLVRSLSNILARRELEDARDRRHAAMKEKE